MRIEFPLLKLINGSRSTYGLRHQDHSRYHSHCSAKISSLRKSTSLSQTSTKARKYTKKNVTVANATTPKHLQVLLYLAERDWSASQLMKSTLTPESGSVQRHHFHKKLSKATGYAKNLLEVCSALKEGCITSTELTQVIIYHKLMSGNLKFEKSNWTEALESLSSARALLQLLGGRIGKEGEELQALSNEFSDEIEPILRFCCYRLGIEMDSVDSDHGMKEFGSLVKELQTQRGEEKISNDFTWRDQIISVRNVSLVEVFSKVKEVLTALAVDQNENVQAVEVVESGKKWGKRKAVAPIEKKIKEKLMSGKRMELFDRALLILTDGELVARQLVDDNKIAQQKLSLRSEAASIPLAAAYYYLLYQLFTVRIARDLLLISSTLNTLNSKLSKIQLAEQKKIADLTVTINPEHLTAKVNKQKAKVYPGVVRLFDSILEGMEKVIDLECVERDGELSAIIDGRINLVKAKRTLFVAKTFALVDNHEAALNLLARGKLYLRQARQYSSDDQEIMETNPPATSIDFSAKLLDLSAVQLDILDQSFSEEEIIVGKSWSIKRNGRISLEDDEAMEVLAGEKKKEEKLPFYDIAFNYVVAFDMDALAIKAGLVKAVPVESAAPVFEMRELKEEVGKVEKKGWFGSFLGRS